MTVYLNDKPLTLAEGATLADALQSAGVAERGTATALNGTVVPAAARPDTVLHEGDKLLILKAFYGG